MKLEDVIVMRDSRGSMLHCTTDVFKSIVLGIKAGEFDDLGR